MSDLHQMPLRGHDLPPWMAVPPARRKAHVFTITAKPRCAVGPRWWWEHKCRENYYAEDGGYASARDAYDAAVQHLERCCR
jgi:hypothetical protein